MSTAEATLVSILIILALVAQFIWAVRHEATLPDYKE